MSSREGKAVELVAGVAGWPGEWSGEWSGEWLGEATRTDSPGKAAAMTDVQVALARLARLLAGA